MPRVSVVRTYLELASPTQLRPAPSPDPALHVERAEPAASVELSRRLYRDVGGEYH